VWRETVPKVLREWMPPHKKWDDAAYRKADGSAWSRIQKAMIAVLKKNNQYMNQGIAQHHVILAH
jgi:hypothetical protein